MKNESKNRKKLKKHKKEEDKNYFVVRLMKGQGTNIISNKIEIIRGKRRESLVIPTKKSRKG